jgi:epoxyqueuosine reductase QueG
MNPAEISARIKARARELGFSGCGILKADPIEEFTAKLEVRIRRFPASQALYEPLRPFAFPHGRAAWARSIVVCTLPYNRYRIPEGLDRYFGKIYLCDMRVPGSPDYKKIAALESHVRELGMQTFGGFIAARWATRACRRMGAS